MTLKETIVLDFTRAFKAGETQRKDTLSLIKGAIQNKEIEKGKKEEGLTDEEVREVLSAEAKKRRDAIVEYEKAGRDEQAQKETEELGIIESYLPPQMSQEEVRSELEKIVSDTGAQGLNDLGKVMGSAMQKMKGRADGSIVREELERILQK